MDLQIFKDRIKQKLESSEFGKEHYTEWRQVREEQEAFGYLYKPRNKLTFRGFIKTCPNDNTKLTKTVSARQWGIFGLWEYFILSCPTCGYKYADIEHIKEV